MAISLNYATKVITVPKADTTLVSAGPPEIREYDVFEKLWKELKNLEDDESGAIIVDAQSHVTTATLGGVTFAHQVKIINGYTVTFEAGSYQVNLIGANHNVLDVANMNSVALRSANSAGLVSTSVSTADKNDIAAKARDVALGTPPAGSVGEAVKQARDAAKSAEDFGVLNFVRG